MTTMKIDRLRPTTTLLSIGLLLLAGACEDHQPVTLGEHALEEGQGFGHFYTSQYLTMSDGTRIAIDVHLPIGLSPDTPLPTILELTRYWRRRGEEELPFIIRHAVWRGFAYVVMDERGTGASFGEWSYPLTDRALEDAREVIDWITQQTWSNGLVGATGVSYSGMAAQQLASVGHPALRAIAPQSDTYDQYEDLIFPGGMFNEFFMKWWSDIVYEMDRNTSIQIDDDWFRLSPVDADPGGELLAQALAAHQGNMDSYSQVRQVTYRDDVMPVGITLDDLSSHTKPSVVDHSGVALYHWGSWFDGGSADGVIRQFMEGSGPQRAVIGAWSHSLSQNASPFLDFRYPSVPRHEFNMEEAINFFDDILRKEKPLQNRILRYYTVGTGEWKSTSEWPVPGTTLERYYLDEGASLRTTAPTSTDGADDYTVDFTALSSPESRWHSPLTGESWYENRRMEDQKLLVYESAPLQEAMEITGYPVVHLNVTSTHTDGAFFVYLEVVDNTGVVRYVTEGILRAIHRRVGTDPAEWKRPIPYHSYRSQDAEPLVPGQVAELSFGLHPTSVMVPAGHRIRIAIAGHDSSVFKRVPETGTPEITIQRNSVHPSYIELPVINTVQAGG